MDIEISKKSTAEQVIKHILTLYRKSADLMAKQPLKYPEDSKAYELRLIDDDEEPYTPFMEIGPRKRDEAIG